MNLNSSMDPKSSTHPHISPDLGGNSPLSCGGNLINLQVLSQYCDHNTVKKKSKVRLNDQLSPKPTDVNMVEKMTKIAMPKQHPYSSHVSKFAMFPTFSSPDDPVTGVRAATKLLLNPLIPKRAPDVILLSKTKGAPYRHEILASPIRTNKEAVVWTGEHGYLDHSKSLKGEEQRFYPTPPKTVLPNPKLRHWDLTLSERVCNMLKNLERTHWLTSYQINYTGSGPARAIKIDDYMEKICSPAGIDSNAALRECSIPSFVASKPARGCRRRQSSCVRRSTYSPLTSELPNPSLSSNQGTAPAHTDQPRPQQITAKHNVAAHPNQRGHGQSKNRSGYTEAQSTEVSQEVSHKQQTERKSSAHEGRERENSTVQFDQSVSQSCQEAYTDTERLLDLHSHPHSQRETKVKSEKCLCVKDDSCSREEDFKARRDVSSLSWSAGAGTESDQLGKITEVPNCNPCILPRPPVHQGILPEGRLGTLSLMDLQNSFSKTEARHNFNSSITQAAVSLRDNVVTGRKHDFYGVNSYYLHG